MRLYWGDLLRATDYWHIVDNDEIFTVRIECDETVRDGKHYPAMKTYRANTLEELYKLLKADGHQIWGYGNVLDYSYHPRNAFEYVLIRDELLRRGNTEEEIRELFGI